MPLSDLRVDPGRRAARGPPLASAAIRRPRSCPIVDDPPSELLATGPVVGLLHRNQVWHAWLFRATDFCWQAVESLEKSHPYEVEAAVAFLDVRARPPARRGGRRPARPAGTRTAARGAGSRSGSTTYPVAPGYAPGEHHFPHDYAPYARVPRARGGSRTRRWPAPWTSSTDEQQEDGGWPIRWRQWAPGTALEARPIVTIEALRTLRAYGRFPGLRTG